MEFSKCGRQLHTLTSDEQVAAWNAQLKKIFRNEDNFERWQEIFKPSYLLRNENHLFETILGVDEPATREEPSLV